MKGVWDGLDKERVSRGVVLAYMSDEYLEALEHVNNAQSAEELASAREIVKDLMSLWREECPEYAFMVDCLYLFSEKIEQSFLAEGSSD
ncbi:hypothetical protein [Desulfovibrio inopinatus]|uniref:hypothetical protein n=1 Tax=Desulfovibrio inopinatus TaxID=102109 RepID=UPI0004204236|nr:hypothetical protein [Desulfovibrio inopinatus]